MKPIVIKKTMTTLMGITIFPFIIVDPDDLKKKKTLLNHETIHWYQELELAVLLFYVLYLLSYFWNLIKYKGDKDKAYMHIIFEKEAYANENNPDYIKTRRPYSWIKYIKTD